MRWPVQYCCYVLEMHIFSNTHLKGLYNSYRSRHRTCMSATTRTVSSQCTHACSANTLNHRTVFFFFWEKPKKKKKAEKELTALVRHCTKKWEGARHQRGSLKKKEKKKVGYCTCTLGMKAPFRRLLCMGKVVGELRRWAPNSREARRQLAFVLCTGSPKVSKQHIRKLKCFFSSSSIWSFQ